MDSNFKLNQLYIFNDLSIGKLITNHIKYPVFENIKTKKQFNINIY